AETAGEVPNVLEYLPLALQLSLPGFPAEASTLAARLDLLGNRAGWLFATAIAAIASAWADLLLGCPAGTVERINAARAALNDDRWPVRDRLRGALLAMRALATAGANEAARECGAEAVALARRFGASPWEKTLRRELDLPRI
ncbi:MAG: hypothetical protein K8T20_14875, partial [Planctomycetes bacterium]|nr:hypothetical protein [Planctomycetota bacterium]